MTQRSRARRLRWGRRKTLVFERAEVSAKTGVISWSAVDGFGDVFERLGPGP
jgi:hypothetical protein